MTSNTPASSSCRFSTRISLRWLPEDAHETTDTIAMSVKDWYLDLRMDRASKQIDWAIAGQRIVESLEPLRVSFTHELDSHNAFESTDCGTFVSLPNGDDLETGTMPRPDLAGTPLTEYEEVWRELPFREGPEGVGRGISWVLESIDDSPEDAEGEIVASKTFLGRIWGTFLALRQTQTYTQQRTPSGDWIVRKTGGDVRARREEWNEGWSDVYVVGEVGDRLPSMVSGLDGEGVGAWRVPGQKVEVNGQVYAVRAFEEIR